MTPVMRRMMLLMASAAIVPTTTLSATDKASAITLSGGSLTASKTAIGHDVVRATASIPAGGKVYMEFTIVTLTIGNHYIGIAIAAASLTNYLGSDTNSIAYIATTSGSVPAIITNNANVITMPAMAAVMNVGLAIDLVNNKAWWCPSPSGGPRGNWNNSGTASPDTNTGGVSISGLAAGALFPAWGAYDSNSVTVNFGATPYVYAAPAGFGNMP